MEAQAAFGTCGLEEVSGDDASISMAECFVPFTG
jgi:hypothetical protein